MTQGKLFEPPPGVVERVAIMMAVGNNGGAWERTTQIIRKHYGDGARRS